MTRNTTGGKNKKKSRAISNKPRELVYKSNGQVYGQIIKSIGNDHMEVMCFCPEGNQVKRAHIRGGLRKKVWMAPGDIVLISMRNYQDNICDIVMKYTADEARILRARKQLPDNIDINKSDMIANESVLVFNDDEANDDSDSDNSPNTQKLKKVPAQTRKYDLPPSFSDDEDEADLVPNPNRR
jgi:Translation initiation factor 1 (IF-1)